MLPAVRAAVAVVGDLGLRARLALELDRARLRYVDLELLVEHNAAIAEIVTRPELSGSEWVHDRANELVLQHIAGTKRRHADVLLVIVGIHQRVGVSNVLNRRFLRGHYCSIGLDHANVNHFQLVAQSAIADL